MAGDCSCSRVYLGLGVALACGAVLQLPHVFTSSAEFESWFSSWNSNAQDSENHGTEAARAALREEHMLIVMNRLHQVLRPFVLRRTKDILETALPPKTERSVACPMSAYQRTMLSLLADKCKSKDIKGVNNVLMEMRKICNDPLLSKLHVPGTDSSLANHCLPSTVQVGGKMAILLQLLHRLHFLGVLWTRTTACAHAHFVMVLASEYDSVTQVRVHVYSCHAVIFSRITGATHTSACTFFQATGH